MQIALLFVRLKESGRSLKLGCERMRTAAQTVRARRAARGGASACSLERAQKKQALDQRNLQLQSLVYEQAHLKREIVACREFKCVVSARGRPSAHSHRLRSDQPEVELVPEAEFMATGVHRRIAYTFAVLTQRSQPLPSSRQPRTLTACS
jgi:hypothetical protein